MILALEFHLMYPQRAGAFEQGSPDAPPGLSPLLSPFSSYAFSLADLVQFHDSQIQPLMSSLDAYCGHFIQLHIALNCTSLPHTKFHLVFPERVILPHLTNGFK